MKTIEAVVVILVIGLAITIFVDISLYSSNQQLGLALNSLNQSYNQLSSQFNRIRSLLPLPESLGLNLSMTLNATTLNFGQSISITLDERNLLDNFNNITTSSNWSYSDFQGYPCSTGSPALPNMPFSIAILQGYYTESNLTSADSLPLFSSPGAYYFCPAMGSPPTEFDFYPSSDQAIINPQPAFISLNGSGSTQITEFVKQTLNFSGYLAPNDNSGTTQTINFPLGVYTVVGGDEWGQLVILHFEVVLHADITNG